MFNSIIARWGTALTVLALAAAPIGAQQPVTGGRALSLSDALRLAESQSEEVRVAEAGVLRARGELLRARSQYFPQLTGVAQYQRTLQSQFEEIVKRNPPPPDTSGGAASQDFGPISRIFASKERMTFGLQGSQTLFAGGRVVAGTRAAAAGRTAAEIGLASARAQVQLDVAQAYWDAALGDRLLAIAESSLVQTENALQLTQVARTVGNTSEFDLLRAQVTRDNQRPVVLERRTMRDLAHMRLKQLLNLPLDAPLALTSAVDETGASGVARFAADGSVAADSMTGARPLAAGDTSVGDRAAVRQSEANVAAQRQLQRIARAQRLPAISLSSQYNRIGYPTGSDGWNVYYPDWTVSLGLQVPLFTGGRIRGDELIAQANLLEARQRHEQVRELAALDARQSIAQLEEAEAAWAASAGTAQQAARAYTIAEVRYKEGLSTQLELTESRILLQQSQANRALAARNLQVARMRLALLKDLPLGTGGTRGAAAGAGAVGAQSAPPQPSRQPQQQPPAGQQSQTGGFTQTNSMGSVLP